MADLGLFADLTPPIEPIRYFQKIQAVGYSINNDTERQNGALRKGSKGVFPIVCNDDSHTNTPVNPTNDVTVYWS